MDSCTRNKVAAGAATAAGLCILVVHGKRCLWRRRCAEGKRTAPALPEDTDILRIGYSKKKVPEKVDHIIVGSGLAGLYTAALLSKAGRRVLVLEQHYVAGGCTHTFKDKGFEFDTGVHYLGEATLLEAMIDFAAGRDGALKMNRSGAKDGSNIYNEIAVGSFKHQMRPGKETYIQDLIDKFPSEAKAIRKFINECFTACAGIVMPVIIAKYFMHPWAWSALTSMPGPARMQINKYLQRTVTQVLDDCGVKDTALRTVLCGEFGDYGVLPDEAPFFIHAGILTHYIWEGSYYPEGGSDTFAAALVPTILEAGGSVLVRAPVKRIVIEGNRAVGVEIENKGLVTASQSVISAAGVEVTYKKLLSDAAAQKLVKAPDSIALTEQKGGGEHMYCFIGFDGTSEELGLPTHNVWRFPCAESEKKDFDVSKAWKKLTAPELPAFLESDAAAKDAEVPCFMSFPSAKDPLYNQRCPGKSTAVSITESRAEYFANAGPTSKRGQEYLTLKERYKTGFLNSFKAQFPHLADKISYVDVATPLSNEHYLGRAGSYGLTHTAERFLDVSLQMKVGGVQNLYVTGQDLLCCGIFPQPIIAIITTAKVLGVTSLDFWILLMDLGTSAFRRVFFRPKALYPSLWQQLTW